MKILSVRECKATLSSALADSQHERILITRHGKPVTLLVGVEGYDLDDLFFAADPDFWKMIEKRRQNPNKLSLAEIRRRFAQQDARVAARRSAARRSRRKASKSA